MNRLPSPAVITAVHTIVYTSGPRRDARVLPRCPRVSLGRHGQRLVDLPDRAERARGAPERVEHGGQTCGTDQQFEVSLICDDLPATMATLAAKGAQFAGDIEQAGWGNIVRLLVPGASAMTLYQPTYAPPATAH